MRITKFVLLSLLSTLPFLSKACQEERLQRVLKAARQSDPSLFNVALSIARWTLPSSYSSVDAQAVFTQIIGSDQLHLFSVLLDVAVSRATKYPQPQDGVEIDHLVKSSLRACLHRRFACKAVGPCACKEKSKEAITSFMQMAGDHGCDLIRLIKNEEATQRCAIKSTLRYHDTMIPAIRTLLYKISPVKPINEIVIGYANDSLETEPEQAETLQARNNRALCPYIPVSESKKKVSGKRKRVTLKSASIITLGSLH